MNFPLVPKSQAQMNKSTRKWKMKIEKNKIIFNKMFQSCQDEIILIFSFFIFYATLVIIVCIIAVFGACNWVGLLSKYCLAGWSRWAGIVNSTRLMVLPTTETKSKNHYNNNNNYKHKQSVSKLCIICSVFFLFV